MRPLIKIESFLDPARRRFGNYRWLSVVRPETLIPLGDMMPWIVYGLLFGVPVATFNWFSYDRHDYWVMEEMSDLSDMLLTALDGHDNLQRS
jgi:hypothetical protein